MGKSLGGCWLPTCFFQYTLSATQKPGRQGKGDLEVRTTERTRKHVSLSRVSPSLPSTLPVAPSLHTIFHTYIQLVPVCCGGCAVGRGLLQLHVQLPHQPVQLLHSGNTTTVNNMMKYNLMMRTSVSGSCA